MLQHPNPGKQHTVPFNFCFVKLSHEFTIWTVQTLAPYFGDPLTLRVGVPDLNAPQNLPGVDVVPHAKFLLCGTKLRLLHGLPHRPIVTSHTTVSPIQVCLACSFSAELVLM